MARRIALVRALCLAAAGLGAAACGVQAAAPSPPGDTWFWDADLGLEFALPPRWVAAPDLSAATYSGPPGSDAYFTTVTVQPVLAGALADVRLDEALEAAYAPLADAPQFAWDWLEPASCGGVAAVRYAVRFELHEALRRKAGVVLDTSAGPVDVAYGASDAVFGAGVDAFEQVLATL